MKYLADKIIDAMDFDIEQLKLSKARNRAKWVDKIRTVRLNDRKVLVKLTKEDFTSFYILKL